MTTTRMQLDNTTPAGPVTCLGQTFASDTARREHFSALLREKLKDPAFRAIEGFPHGADDDIIALSDPPYYTACPNPWLADFVAEWEAAKPQAQREAKYHHDPYASDVSEGRSGLFYDAHSYHTKVPHKAIMHYILHYTKPGDIIFDGFAGTGMAGVAAQMCNNPEIIKELGYSVDSNGNIYNSLESMKAGVSFSRVGVRHAILNDLSPIASFIASTYNTPLKNPETFSKQALQLLQTVETELGWMYKTKHSTNNYGKLNYVIWSDVFLCQNCLYESAYWNLAVDMVNGGVLEEFKCPKCGILNTKTSLERVWVNTQNGSTNQMRAKQIPVLIEYSIGNKRFTKSPDTEDLQLINKINDLSITTEYPTNTLINGHNTRQPQNSHGVQQISDFYTKRNLLMLSSLRDFAKKSPISKYLLFFINSYDTTHSTLMSRLIYKKGDTKWTLTGYQSGTLYISSLPVEKNILYGLKDSKLSIIDKSLKHVHEQQIITTQSSTGMSIKSNTIDYIFIDPPFGANIMYSELNYLAESWLKVWTNNTHEAIENQYQSKNLNDYKELMTSCFREAYRILKPSRWITIEFSNTSAAVWNCIQSSLQDAGFIVANVSALNKKQGSFKAVTTPTAVKQDLIISAYKPSEEFDISLTEKNLAVDGVWDFIRSHLGYLPVVKRSNSNVIQIPERDPRILYDQVIAYYIRRGFPVPIDSLSFQAGLAQRFKNHDGMYFLEDQAVEYERAVQQAGNIIQANMFVSDESSAILWLRQVLKRKPQIFSDINPEFMQQLGGWSKNDIQLDLRILLEQNFLNYNGEDAVPNQIHAYLSSNYQDMRNKADTDPALRAKAKDRWYVPDPNKAQDLEQVRERALLREFDGYVTQTGKLKKIRLEAIRAGFKRAYQKRDYQTIVTMAKRLQTTVIEEDEKLLMWVDNATMRIGV